MAKRGETWSEKKILALVAIRGNEEIPNKPSNTLHVQCRNKMKQMKGMHKNFKIFSQILQLGEKKPKVF